MADISLLKTFIIMRKFLRDFFSFTRTESRTILVLSVILFVILTVRTYTDSLIPDPYVPTEEEMSKINEFFLSHEISDTAKEDGNERSGNFYSHLRNFDPNVVSTDDMKDMGFPGSIISNVTKYRNAGGRFRNPGDFSKIYGITDSLFSIIRPFLDCIDTVKNRRQYRTILRININTADSSELVRLVGIGPVYASRIIKYRRLLGGFHLTEQLLEVYGFDSVRYNQIKGNVYADASEMKKIDINTIDFRGLKKHPYIGPSDAAAIIKYREFKGRIDSISEIDTFNVIPQNAFKKIEPYIIVLPD